ncbi:MAG: zinc ABC transporter substrate-binding protein [Methanothrix sp.]|nr:zinc ABC transporter substrate-binding protein [Methanothrix sp.]
MPGYFDLKLMLIYILLSAALCGCISSDEHNAALSQNDSASSSDRIRVAATIAPLADLVRAVGGDRVDVTVVVPPGAEPHTFEPTPSLMVKLSQADLYVMNGAGLEFWMDKLLETNRDLEMLDSSSGIELLQGEGEESDPHIWLSLRNAARQVKNICSGLSDLDPDHREYYAQNRDDYLRRLMELDEEFNRSFAINKSRIFVVDHPSWSYFARDYGLEQIPLMVEEKEPGPRYLSQVIDLARQSNISTIFVEPQFNPKAAEVIAREMSARVIRLDPLASNYLENMRYAGREIANSMASG